MSEMGNSKAPMGLEPEDKTFLLQGVRKTIENVVLSRARPVLTNHKDVFREERGAFVSLHLKRALRGCIGYIESNKTLVETLLDAAEGAAVRDPRFAPVSAKELSQLEIEISVLSIPRRIQFADEIEVGIHGIIVESGNRKGILLPQVATEWAWGREEFLGQTCRKAGLDPECWKDGKAVIQIFSADIFNDRGITP